MGVISLVSTLHAPTHEGANKWCGEGGVHSGEVVPYLCIDQGGEALRWAAHYMGGESKKLGYLEAVLPHALPTMGNPDSNEKIGEVGIS